MSHMLRYILKGWTTRVERMKKKTKNNRDKKKHPDPAGHYPMTIDIHMGDYSVWTNTNINPYVRSNLSSIHAG